jgi:formylglycine-generating enzyme required for sulfatase activity
VQAQTVRNEAVARLKCPNLRQLNISSICALLWIVAAILTGSVVDVAGASPDPMPRRISSPTLTGISPGSGPISGGTTITLTGTNLVDVISVTVGDVAASNIVILNSTTLTAVTPAVPASMAGLRTVRVTTAAGIASILNGFRYFIVPSWATVVEGVPNASVVTNSTLRNAILASGYAWRVRDTATNIQMLLVPPGTFNMGCSPSTFSPCASHENPVHSITLTSAFYLGRYEVTQAQWTARMGSNPSAFQSPSAQVPAPLVSSRPVEQVSWTAVQAFLSATGMRLPTEAEWEFAYRAGTTAAFHSMPAYPNGTNDDNQVDAIAWWVANSIEQTRPFGGRSGNALGFHDMAGNVWEWVSDWYSATYYASSPAVDPQGPATGTNRVLRGGAWIGVEQGGLRASNRFAQPPESSSAIYGFRVARSPGPPPPTIASVAPTSGPTMGGTAFTLTGSSLAGTTAVTIGGAAATNVVVVNGTTLTAVTPPGSAGPKTVAVTTPGGTATLSNGFTYVAPWYTVLEQSPDPTVVADPALRNAIVATGLPWRVRDTETQIELLLVPPGTFSMGCSQSSQTSCADSETPVRTVTLTRAFYLGRYEVTQTEWRNRVGSNPSYFQGASYPDAANRPVERVPWSTVTSFLDAAGLRLPTEAEWEYAYRAGTTTAFHGWPIALNIAPIPGGTNDESRVGVFAWFFGNSGDVSTSAAGTKVVGQLAANGLGLHDMAGNVAEYTGDWFGPYLLGPATDPVGPSGGLARVVRGGSWIDQAGTLRASARSSAEVSQSAATRGFRAARWP